MSEKLYFDKNKINDKKEETESNDKKKTYIKILMPVVISTATAVATYIKLKDKKFAKDIKDSISDHNLFGVFVKTFFKSF